MKVIKGCHNLRRYLIKLLTAVLREVFNERLMGVNVLEGVAEDFSNYYLVVPRLILRMEETKESRVKDGLVEKGQRGSEDKR